MTVPAEVRLGSNVTKVAAALMASSFVLVAGCSTGHEEQLPVRSASAVEDEISGLSSRVLDMMNVKGKVTEPGAYTSHCSDDDPSKGYWVRHPWSLYGIDNSKLGQGFDNLKRALPGDGWKIVKEGDDGSRNKNLEVLAVHQKTRSQLEVRWLEGLDGNEPLLGVTVYSQCFEKSK